MSINLFGTLKANQNERKPSNRHHTSKPPNNISNILALYNNLKNTKVKLLSLLKEIDDMLIESNSNIAILKAQNDF